MVLIFKLLRTFWRIELKICWQLVEVTNDSQEDSRADTDMSTYGQLWHLSTWLNPPSQRGKQPQGNGTWGAYVQMVEEKVERGLRTTSKVSATLHSTDKWEILRESQNWKKRQRQMHLNPAIPLKTFPLGITDKLVQKIHPQSCTYTSFVIIMELGNYQCTQQQGTG